MHPQPAGSTRPVAAQGRGPLNWRVLVDWLREDGVISADEAARTVTRCDSAHSRLHPLERLAAVGVTRTDGTLLDIQALTQWLAARCEDLHLRWGLPTAKWVRGFKPLAA